MSETSLPKRPRRRGKTPLQRALRKAGAYMFAFVALVGVVAALFTYALLGSTGLPAVALSTAVGFVLAAVTVGSHRLAMVRPELVMAWMGMDFLLKLVTLIIALLITRKNALFDANVAFYTLLILVIGLMLVSAVSLAKARIPLLEQSDVEPKSE